MTGVHGRVEQRSADTPVRDAGVSSGRGTLGGDPSSPGSRRATPGRLPTLRIGTLWSEGFRPNGALEEEFVWAAGATQEGTHASTRHSIGPHTENRVRGPLSAEGKGEKSSKQARTGSTNVRETCNL